MSSDKKLMGTTLITAIAASLCCIGPVLALIAGTSGIASTFSWIAPFRPYLIALTVVVLAVAWYQKLKPKKQEIDCDCEDEKPRFINSKKFLFLITIFAGAMLAFPYYSQMFYPDTAKEVSLVGQSNIAEANYSIEGMTCSGCEAHIESEVNKLEGIIAIEANYEEANTIVKYDKSKIATNEIEAAILSTGYEIIDLENKNKTMEMGEKDSISFHEVGLVCNAAPSIGCGSRSKPILLALSQQDEIKEAKLNREGTIIRIIWEDHINISSRQLITDNILKSNKVDSKLLDSDKIPSSTWLGTNDMDVLSAEEAAIIATQLITVYKKKAGLTEIQEDNLRNDIEKVFYDFFLNYKALEQLSDSKEYRKLILKITDASQAYIKAANIPSIGSLLESCEGHSEKCDKSSCCTPKSGNNKEVL